MNDSYSMARSGLVRLSRFAAFATCLLMGAKAQPLQSGVSVGQNRDGRLEIFTILNGSVWHNWQLGYGGLWSGWVSLGAPVYGLCNQIPQCDIGVGLNSGGRMQIFVKTSQYNQIYTAWQTQPGGAWSIWVPLDAPEYCCADSAPAVGQNADGRLELLVNGIDNNVWHKWQFLPGGGWLGWENLGDGRANGRPTVARNLDGRLEVFVISNGSAILHSTQVCAGCDWSGFTYVSSGWVNSWPGVGQNSDDSNSLRTAPTMLSTTTGSSAQEATIRVGPLWVVRSKHRHESIKTGRSPGGRARRTNGAGAHSDSGDGFGSRKFWCLFGTKSRGVGWARSSTRR
jgi:hypothetical protein